MSGIIYRITNTTNQKFYIGKTTRTLQKRWREHCRAAKRGTSYRLYNAIRKYGIDSFIVEVVEEVPSYLLNEREVYWIETLSPVYNMTSGGDGQTGLTHSTESKMKMRDARLRLNTKGINNPFFGKTHSDEARRKMSAAAKKRCTTEWRARMSERMMGDSNVHRGKPKTQETKDKMRAAKIGHSVSQKTREKISKSLRKKKHA